MKPHNGMRPHDIVVLLKLITLKKPDWQYRDLAAQLFISVSEISESLYRSQVAGLTDVTRKKVHRQALFEFLQHGLPYVFPQIPGGMVTGLPTAHSHPYYKEKFVSDIQYAWPDDNGTIRGLTIQPLHKGVTKAAMEDDELYKLLASIDIIRVGKTRELKFALEVIKSMIL